MKTNFSFLSCLLLLPALLTAQVQAGDTLFGAAYIHNLYLQFPFPAFYDTLLNTHASDYYVPATLSLDGSVYDSVGVKFKGNSSFNNSSQKKSMKIDLDEFVNGQKHDGIKKFNLNNGFKDPSFLREKLCLDMMNESGAAAPRCAYAQVYLNNQYWGLYMLVEEVNNKFLEQRFANKDSNLYKGDPNGDLKWMGNLPQNYYNKYELEAHTDGSNDWRDLVYLLDKINNSPPAQFYDSLEKVLDTEAFISYWAFMNLFVNLDSYIGSGHNYYLYHNSADRRFETIGWDMNEAFGNFKMNYTSQQLLNYSLFATGNPGSRPLIEKMVANPTYKQRLADKTCELLNLYFREDLLFPKIDSLADAIRQSVFNDTKKFFSNAQFDLNMNQDLAQGNFTMLGLKPFITQRIQSLKQELAPYGCFVTALNPAASANVKVYTSDEKLHILTDASQPTLDYQIWNVNGQQCMAGSAYTGESIDIQRLGQGVYVLGVEMKGQRLMVKFIK